MKERAFRFGEQGNLIGVLAEPDAGAPRGRPVALLFNVGLNHRVGPYRLNVDLARDLARRGFASLRFDLSGQGDSEPRRGTEDGQARGVSDLHDAMAFVERKRGATCFALVALCSGVDPAHAAAVSDPRIVAAAFIDGYAYPTPRSLARARWERLYRRISPRRLQTWLQRKLATAAGKRRPSETGAAPPEIFKRVYPPAAEFRADLEAMVARRVRLLFAFTWGAAIYNYERQFGDMIGVAEAPSGVEVEYWRTADHIFTAVADRARVVGRIGSWMEGNFAAAPSPTVEHAL